MTNTAEKLTLPLFMVKYNGDLLISTGRSRFETSWKNKTMSWAALLNKLSRSMETTETHAEYMKMSKEQQDKIKDIGGFVGGHLRDGRRKTGYVTARQLLTLDLDFPPAEFWDNIIDNLEIDNALAVYSTHKHTKAKPRYDGFTAAIDGYIEALETKGNTDLTAVTEAMKEFQRTSQNAFNEWFATVQGLLDEDVAGRLINKTSDLDERLTALEYMIIHNDLFTHVVDDDGNPILDDDGNAIIGDWKYKTA